MAYGEKGRNDTRDLLFTRHKGPAINICINGGVLDLEVTASREALTGNELS